MSDSLKGNDSNGATLTPQIKFLVAAAENYWSAKCAFVCVVAEFNSDACDLKDEKEKQLNMGTAMVLDAEAMLCQAIRAHLKAYFKENKNESDQSNS